MEQYVIKGGVPLSGEVEIGDVYYLIVDIYHTKQEPIPKITNIEYLVNRVGTRQGGVLYETTEWICPRKAISARIRMRM